LACKILGRGCAAWLEVVGAGTSARAIVQGCEIIEKVEARYRQPSADIRGLPWAGEAVGRLVHVEGTVDEHLVFAEAVGEDTFDRAHHLGAQPQGRTVFGEIVAGIEIAIAMVACGSGDTAEFVWILSGRAVADGQPVVGVSILQRRNLCGLRARVIDLGRLNLRSGRNGDLPEAVEVEILDDR
jgi:hypothetical protein